MNVHKVASEPCDNGQPKIPVTDGYPGIPGIGAKTAGQLLNRHGPIEKFPSNALGKQRDLAPLFKKLATLRTDAPLFKRVGKLRWCGPTPAFAA